MNKLLFLLTFISFSAFAINDAEYAKLIEKHNLAGQLSEQDSQRQVFEHHNDKEWKDDYKEQIRSVSSTFKKKEIINFKNQEIEIPTN